MDEQVSGRLNLEKWVKDKLEQLAVKLQDSEYQECANIFKELTQNVSTHKDKIVKLVDDAYSNYVNDLSRQVIMCGEK